MFVRWGSIGLGVVALAVGAFIFLGAQAVRPVQITGTIANYAEVSTSAGYDHNELRLTNNPNTYLVNRTTFQPSLPDKLYLDGKVVLWVNAGTENVIALTLYDQHDQHPTNYTTPDFQHPYQAKENTRLLAAGVGGGGLILILLGVVIPMILPGRKPARERTAAAYAGPMRGAYATGDDTWGGYNARGARWDDAPAGYGPASQGGYDTGGYDGGGYNDSGYDTGGYDPNGYSQEDYARDPYARNDYGGEPAGPRGHGRGGYDQGGYDQGGYERGGYGQSPYGPPPGHAGGRYDEDQYGQAPYDPRADPRGPYGPPPGLADRGWAQPPAAPFGPDRGYGDAGGYGPPGQPPNRGGQPPGWGQPGAGNQQAPWPPQPPPGRVGPPSGRRPGPMDPYDPRDQGGPPHGGRSRPR